MKDYYEVLGVKRGATAAEIKSAYRKQALEWHPDRNKAPEANDRFKQINEAYQVLSDAQKKQTYDQVGHDAYTRGNMGSASGGGAPGAGYGQQGPFSYSTQGFDFDFGGADPFDIFEQFFGGRSPFGSAGGRARPRRNIYEMTISFDEAVHGVEKTTVIEGKEKKIKVPAGVDDNMRIRFQDFDVLVHVRPSPTFKREGQDIYVEKQISYAQAVLGDVIDVKTIDDSVKIKVRPGTESGSMIRLKEKGVPYPNTKRRGDQYVVIKIHVPEKVSGKAKKILEELKKELA
ncbi:MAG: DnaJ C-terminal domain-containing protein [Weeksellaceae bacterium]